MAIIPQTPLFTWEFLETMPDIERIKLVLNYLPDEDLASKLEAERGQGRNDYPVRAMWNLVVCFLLTGHRSWAALLRELRRNAGLATLCGFDPSKGLPQACNLSRFLSCLLLHEGDILAIFHSLVETLTKQLPEFGKQLAIDSKAIRSYARKTSDKERKDGEPDRRGEHDADVGKKTKFEEKPDGTVEELLYEWFGFKLHLTVDSTYQLPVSFHVTKGLKADTIELDKLVDDFKQNHPETAERTEIGTADKAYDSYENIRLFRETLDAEFLCPTRKLWNKTEYQTIGKDEKPILLKLLPDRQGGDLTYDQDGQVYCAFQKADGSWDWRPMAHKGFEADRQAQKYICPARACGMNCPSSANCSGGYGQQVRVKLSVDPRIFTPTPRHSRKFHHLYNHRTAVERVNSVLDTTLGLEWHTLRGLAMTKLRVTLSLTVILAMAVGRIKNNQKELLGSLVRAA
jgi:hypothetical protein